MIEKTKILVETGAFSIYLHSRAKSYVEYLNMVMRDTSRSEIIEDMIKYVREEELAEDIWGSDWTDALEEFEESKEEEEKI